MIQILADVFALEGFVVFEQKVYWRGSPFGENHVVHLLSICSDSEVDLLAVHQEADI